MSNEAKALLHYAGNARLCCADDRDRDYCLTAAAHWAAHIIGAGC